VDTDHTWTETSATIRVAGLDRAVRILHVTDSHISRDPETEPPYDDCSARMHAAYSSYDTSGAFRDQMQRAASERVDLIALTGDQVNYPSTSSVEFIADEVERTGIPHIYTAGNHDWHYEGLPGDSGDLRRQWRAKRLAPLYRGAPSHSSLEIGNLRFVAIDNATSQVDEAQFEFFRQQAAHGIPLVLLCHIPLALPSLREDGLRPLCGDPIWGAATDRNWKIERRQRWPESGNAPSTTAFYETISQTPSLVAILTGHIHMDRADPIHDSAVQYATKAGIDGSCRLFTFLPLD
jgi:hypothetical protein